MALIVHPEFRMENMIPDATGTWQHFIDNVQLDSHNIPPRTHNHSGDTRTQRFTAKVTAVISANPNGFNLRIIIRDGFNNSLLEKIGPTILTTGTFHLELIWMGSQKAGQPTYLEELAKLDQYSSPQYYPRRNR